MGQGSTCPRHWPPPATNCRGPNPPQRLRKVQAAIETRVVDESLLLYFFAGVIYDVTTFVAVVGEQLLWLLLHFVRWRFLLFLAALAWD